MITKENIIEGLHAVQDFRDHIPSFISSKERDREFEKLKLLVVSLGLSGIDELFNQVELNRMDLLAYVDEGFKGKPFRVVKMDDYRTTPFLLLREQDKIPDTLYLGICNRNAILTPPDKYSQLNLSYCIANNIETAPATKLAIHFRHSDTLVLCFILKDIIHTRFQAEYMRHLVQDALVTAGVTATKDSNDLLVNSKKVFGVGKLMQHTANYKNVVQVHSILSFSMSPSTFSLFLGAFNNPADGHAVLDQIGGIGISDVNTFIDIFELSIKKILGSDITISSLNAEEQAVLNSAGVCF